ncbi:hypothetical protein [Streptomyces violaceusniger]|uniref:Integral membrane protein n=1 Tax=Streptomyces violaceusniger (strain Tu 4113) TaxID=653045 RepID=G2PBG8_STRV4|nr:hypothetical protein [Streptomyces violaceusniger]AEM80367.1 putative integral membrane protein [Streptomyces violaceusniger Tu 4113]
MSLGGDDGYGGDYEGHEARRGRGAAPGDHLTRTRLPEGDGDPYGPARRAPGRVGKPSRNLITVVSVVVLLLAAIAFVNRSGGKDGGSSSNDTGGTGTEARPTAPTGERPVDGKNNTTGIASGFAKSEQGAQSAAANYAVALGSAHMYNRDRRHEIVPQIFTSAAADRLQSRLDKAYSEASLERIGLDASGKAPDGMTYVSRTAPVGTKVGKVSDTSATVAVWCTGVFGTAGEGSKNPVTNDWFTLTLKLRWVNNDWKAESYSQKAGPAPVNSDRTASTADEIAKAVEQYGGFTYAR